MEYCSKTIINNDKKNIKSNMYKEDKQCMNNYTNAQMHIINNKHLKDLYAKKNSQNMLKMNE